MQKKKTEAEMRCHDLWLQSYNLFLPSSLDAAWSSSRRDDLAEAASAVATAFRIWFFIKRKMRKDYLMLNYRKPPNQLQVVRHRRRRRRSSRTVNGSQKRDWCRDCPCRRSSSKCHSNFCFNFNLSYVNQGFFFSDDTRTPQQGKWSLGSTEGLKCA